MEKTTVSDFFRRFKTAIFAVVLLVCFGLIIYFTKDIKLLVVNTTVTARFWPTVIGAAGCLLSVLLFIQGVIEGLALKRQEESGQVEKPPQGARFFEGANLRSLITLGLMFLYILGLEYFGFLAMTLVYLYLQILTLADKGKRHWGKLALITVVFTAVIYLVFRYGFQMMLPEGRVWSLMGGGLA